MCANKAMTGFGCRRELKEAPPVDSRAKSPHLEGIIHKICKSAHVSGQAPVRLDRARMVNGEARENLCRAKEGVYRAQLKP